MATIELLTMNGWSEPMPLEQGVALEPFKEGIQVRQLFDSIGSAINTGNILYEAGPAVRITCKGGVPGTLLGTPLPLDLNEDKRPPIPPGWGYLDHEIRDSPIPGLPPVYGYPPPIDFSPGGVVIGGGAYPPDEGTGEENSETGPSVLVGTTPGIVSGETLPWPWGDGPWTWPWPPHDGELGGSTSGAEDGVIIFGETLEASVRIEGCECIRKNESTQYEGFGVPEGGDYKWTISDSEIAEIVEGENQKICKVEGKKIGKVILEVVYTSDQGVVTSVMILDVLYQRFTPRDKPRGEIGAIPLIHPYPKVRFKQTPQLDYQINTKDISVENRKGKYLLI